MTTTKLSIVEVESPTVLRLPIHQRFLLLAIVYAFGYPIIDLREPTHRYSDLKGGNRLHSPLGSLFNVSFQKFCRTPVDHCHSYAL